MWDDGHKWCFSCGYYIPASGIVPVAEIASRLRRETKGNRYYNLSLPSDFSFTIRPDAVAWLRKYGITDEEIRHNNIGWSESHEYLVFTVFDPDGNLCLWQGRYFGGNPEHHKYDTKGNAGDVFHIVGDRYSADSVVVLVEDCVSAIKVARDYPAMALFGSEIVARLSRLSRITKNLVIWLDPDKTREAVKAAKKAEPLFETVRVIISDFDPKMHDAKDFI